MVASISRSVLQTHAPITRTLPGATAKRSVSSNCQYFSENDRIFLRHVKNPEKTFLTAPLAAHKTFNSHHGAIPHSELISRRARDVIATNSGTEFRLSWPTLEEYITRVPRLVTPVYPLDAATIASLLDIHVEAGASPALEVFEAGTGHGSLTLALARAVHAGNAGNAAGAERGAVVHSLDISERNSRHARGVVAGFRRGMYVRDVEYYVGDPSEWMRAQLAARGLVDAGEGFLYAVVLDLPQPEDHLAAAAQALLGDGIVGVFCPSITQIAACVKTAKGLALPLALDRVVEFPGSSGVGAGLRGWDVRYARVRSRAAKPPCVLRAENRDDTVHHAVEGEEDAADDLYEMVCRPTSFERMVGGGFFAMFRRKARGGEGRGSAKNAKHKQETGNAEQPEQA